MRNKTLEQQADELLAQAEAQEQAVKEQSVGRYEVVSTKVSGDEYSKLMAIVEQKDTTLYALLQYALSIIIRSLDKDTEVGRDLQRAIVAFGVDMDKVEEYCLANPSVGREVQGAIFLMGDTGYKGMQPVMVDRPFFGQCTWTENVGDIVEMVLRYANPAMWKILLQEKRRRGKDSVYHLLTDVVAELTLAEDREEMDLSMSDTRKNDFGREMVDAPYRRTMVNSMESFERRQTRLEF